MKINWVPFWVSNETVADCSDRFGDIKRIKNLKDNDGIATGVTEMVLSMREGDQRYIPYFTSVERNKVMEIAPGRPPICFRCEGVGHMRHECPDLLAQSL